MIGTWTIAIRMFVAICLVIGFGILVSGCASREADYWSGVSKGIAMVENDLPNRPDE